MAFAACIFFGLDYFSFFNLKDLAVVWMVSEYFLSENTVYKMLLLALIYPTRIYLFFIILFAEILRAITSSKVMVRMIVIALVFISLKIFSGEIINFGEEFRLASESSMALTKAEGYAMSGINVLSVKGFLISFIRFFLTPLPFNWTGHPVDLLKLDSILLILFYVLGAFGFIRKKLFQRTEFYFVVILTAFYAFMPFLAIPRHKYTMIIVMFILLIKVDAEKRFKSFPF